MNRGKCHEYCMLISGRDVTGEHVSPEVLWKTLVIKRKEGGQVKVTQRKHKTHFIQQYVTCSCDFSFLQHQASHFLAPPNLYRKTKGCETRHSFPVTNGWSFISTLFFYVEWTALQLLYVWLVHCWKKRQLGLWRHCNVKHDTGHPGTA
jgi:hypothetical protein